MPMADPAGDTGTPTARLLAAQPQLFVADVGRASAYYRDRLGFAIVYLYGAPPFYGLVARDGASLNLRHVDRPPIDPDQREREQLLSANIPVADVERLYAEFASAGVDFQQRLATQPWGTRDFVVRDPDGNLLCFAGALDHGAADPAR